MCAIFKHQKLNPPIYIAISLTPTENSIYPISTIFSSNTIQISIKQRKKHRGNDADFNDFIENNFKDQQQSTIPISIYLIKILRKNLFK